MLNHQEAPVDRALYFPYINVPDDQWFARALLYWDAVGTIRPRGYVENRERWRGTTFPPYASDGSSRAPIERFRHTETLIDLGLVVDVDPDDAPAGIPGYLDAFLELLDVEDERLRRVSGRYGIDIHIGKLGPDLFDELRRRGFARISSGAVWCQMNPCVADLFMAYLALSLSGLPQYAMTPVTDSERALAAMSSEPGADLGVAVARQTLLSDVLVAPKHVEDYRALVRFKGRYREQLTAFRRRVEAEAQAIAVLPETARDAHANLAVERLRDERDEIAAHLEEHRWLVATGALALSGAAATIGLALHDGDVVTAGSSVLSTVAAMRTVINRGVLPDASMPMAYAALSARAHRPKRSRSRPQQ